MKLLLNYPPHQRPVTKLPPKIQKIIFSKQRHAYVELFYSSAQKYASCYRSNMALQQLLRVIHRMI